MDRLESCTISDLHINTNTISDAGRRIMAAPVYDDWHGRTYISYLLDIRHLSERRVVGHVGLAIRVIRHLHTTENMMT